MRISCGAGRRSKGDGRQISLARLAWPLAPIDNTSAFGLNVTHASSPSPLFLLENLPSNLAIGTPCFDLLKNEITEFTLSPMDEISWIMCDRPRVFFRDPNFLDRLTGKFFSFLGTSETKRNSIFVDITCRVSISGALPQILFYLLLKLAVS